MSETADKQLSPILERSDSFGDKLLREAQVLSIGISRGLIGASQDRLLENPLKTSLEMTGLSALSYGFVKLASSSTPIRYFGTAFSAALGFSFVRDLSNELPTKLNGLASVLGQTWNSPAQQDLHAKQISEDWGHFLFDTGLGLGFGLTGAKIAAVQVENKSLAAQMHSKYAHEIDKSVFRAESEPYTQDGLRYIGTSFAVDQSRLATAFHVVKDDPGRIWSLQNRLGDELKANVIAGHPGYDLALFEVKGEKPLAPLAVSGEPYQLHSVPGAVVGAADGGPIVMKPAFFKSGSVPLYNQFKTENSIENGGGYLLPALRSANGRPGMSGGPAISAETGEVIGVLNSISYGVPTALGIGTASIPSQALKSFINMVNEGSIKGSSLSLQEASTEFGIPSATLVGRLQSGKQVGFLVPSSNNVGDVNSSWEWRVMRRPPSGGK